MAGRAGVAVALAATLGLALALVGAAHAASDHLEGLNVQVLPTPVPAPAFRLSDTAGAERSVEGLRGSIVLLNFWATWCVPCRDELPAMERLHREYRGRGLSVVGVNFKESPSDVQSFIRVTGLTFANLLDRDGAVGAKYRVRGLPVTFLLDREGRVRWKAIGAREWDGPHGRAHLEDVLRGRFP